MRRGLGTANKLPPEILRTEMLKSSLRTELGGCPVRAAKKETVSSKLHTQTPKNYEKHVIAR